MGQDGDSEQEVEDPDSGFVEVDATGRYGRYKEVLGKGAFKKVYKAFDLREGLEVAWNQVKVTELLKNSEDLERLYAEVRLLKQLKHKNIIKFYHSWVDTELEHINFITEIFTSGNLRQYRKKHKHVDLRALKKWSRQILEGLLYLHCHVPPIIHRDLKCDNIFVNGNHGELKIGDLGFAAILRQAQAAHSVIGTPEFMAPELYEEKYNELVDIYAFGMCMLELVTFEYPYSECSNAAQIYKKVTSGIKPASLAKVTDPGVKAFIEKCLADVSERLSAKQLLEDPFLLPDEEHDSVGRSSLVDPDLSVDVNQPIRTSEEHLHQSGRDFTVRSVRTNAKKISIMLKIADSTGHFHNIDFDFDIESDTSIAVASEMVHALDLTDQDVTIIAEIIELEVRSHIPDWSSRESCSDESLLGSHSYENKDENSPNASAFSSGSFLVEQSATQDVSLEAVELPQNEDASSEQLGNQTHESMTENESIGERAAATSESSTNGTFDSRNLDHHDGSVEDDTKGNPAIHHETGSEEVHAIANKLEYLLAEQQKELEALKLKHESAVANLLNGLPTESRLKVLDLCSSKSPDYKLHLQMNLYDDHSKELVDSCLLSYQQSHSILDNNSDEPGTLQVGKDSAHNSMNLLHVPGAGKLLQAVGKLGKWGIRGESPVARHSFGDKLNAGIAVILTDNSEKL